MKKRCYYRNCVEPVIATFGSHRGGLLAVPLHKTFPAALVPPAEFCRGHLINAVTIALEMWETQPDGKSA